MSSHRQVALLIETSNTYARGILRGVLAYGQKPGVLNHPVPPVGVRTRYSTHTLFVEDDDIATAVRMIREGACGGISVHDVVSRLPLSRRMLESRFQKLLGRTPHAEILRVRLERAKSMLSHPNWTLDAIAARTGFRHGEYFSAVFKRGGPGTERDHRVPLQKQTKRIPRRARTARQESHRPLGYRFLRDLYGLCVQLPRDPPELKSRPG